MPNRICNGFPKHLLKVQLEADRDRCFLAIVGDAAIDRPLLAEPPSQRTELFDGLGKVELAISAECQEKAANFPLFFNQQALQFVEIVADFRSWF